MHEQQGTTNQHCVSTSKKKVSEGTFNHRFVVTGAVEIPIQVLNGLESPTCDLRTSHEEADKIIVQQCYKTTKKLNYNVVRIISDDADVFVLACYHYPEKGDLTVYMEPTKKVRTIVNIGNTVRKHINIMPSLIQAYAIGGCDSVGQLPGELTYLEVCSLCGSSEHGRNETRISQKRARKNSRANYVTS